MSGVTYFDTDMNGYMEPCEGGRWVRADDYDALAARLAEAEQEVAKWRKSFGGHVYVPNGEYSALVKARDQAEARVRELEAGP